MMNKYFTHAHVVAHKHITTKINGIEVTGMIISVTDFPSGENFATIKFKDGNTTPVFFSRIISLS